jgi:Integrase
MTAFRFKLSDAALRRLKPGPKPYKISDGRGLHLLVKPNGSCLWRLAYRFQGKQKLLALGRYPEVGLAEARRRTLDARRLLAAGRDPSAERRAERQRTELTFAKVAEKWFAEGAAERWDAGTAKTKRYRLERFVLPAIGDLPIAEIETRHIMPILVALKDRPETARRVRQIVSGITRWAIVHGMARHDPAGALGGVIPQRPVRSYAAITDPRRLGELLRAVWNDNATQPTVKAALQLLAYTFVRPGELRGMCWRELDTNTAEWRIPATRTKARREHVVPLSRQVLVILENLRPLTGHGELVLPGMRPGRPLSENSLNAALRRLGFGKDDMTSHGFRAVATSLLNEMGFRPDIIERQLAHREQGVRAVYHRSGYLAERREMMQRWADYLDGLREGRTVRAVA